jgi:hypothetical protein
MNVFININSNIIITYKFIKIYIYSIINLNMKYWGLGIGDWGLGIGPNPQSPIPNPQSPIPNPHLLISK